ncbi:MAG TPA: hypothetical protein ENK44_14750 [Caldithrix abyssi]|uniref:Uncharacterized protein n=1 Tax=Caldithrix abyssi TaxID=187145 RepID=A0A7V4U2Q7_CALAY|nr:hypothetical protein [Caldithrix abyssi]
MENKFIFKNYNDSAKNNIQKLLEYLLPMKNNIYQKYDRFTEEPFVFTNKKDLFEKIEKDIKYQEYIAEEIIKFSIDNSVKTRLKSFYWECVVEDLETSNFLSIYLYVEPKNKKYGNIIFPIEIILTDKNEFKYWEICHIDVALQATKELILR